MLKNIIAIIIIFLLSGCSFATKTKELGSGMTNVTHPIVFLPGLALYKIGLSLEEKEIQEKKELNEKSEESKAEDFNNVEEETIKEASNNIKDEEIQYTE